MLTADMLTRLADNPDHLIGWWKLEDAPEDKGEVLDSDEQHVLWFGARQDVLRNDVIEEAPTRGTTDVLINTSSAALWLQMFDGDAEAAAEAANAQVAHDADLDAPDCNVRDPFTGYTCTLEPGHDSDEHVAGTGHACIAHVYTVSEG